MFDNFQLKTHVSVFTELITPYHRNVELFLIMATVPFKRSCPEWDSNMGWRRMAVIEDCQAPTPTTGPPWPV